ncbi:hypothetical protein AGABI1DRAFT_94939 [Agaricus bisporus var. burnettii JB137-S8]|uniref:Uncharacterized protein n=1 Tax=Agaricus bisporus var. burnettii (strain JB137-S8 / ATCC MYA-4627 / FGSC 10392) TaxID=597362 RepID=K5WJD5_AGABU|nr:uncharacterized protein AGABI1DRAFT_94939 [Agaricus bisporus var. burnettii JB137-S8]EKM75416.1 hypothetical protein AGABI1DRAFT_94939 [Agaricus bisporus var. burnettii JB137-S8]
MSYYLSRSIVRRATRVPHRTFITVRFGDPSAGNKSRWLLVLSGFAGGAVITVSGGYALYRWSGLGYIVDKIRHVTRNSEQPTDSQNGTVAQLFFGLRMLAKTYVAEIPGACFLVDKVFDHVENVVDSHQEKARAVLEAAMRDIQDAVKARGEDTTKAAWDVLIILRDKLSQIQAIAPAINQIKIGALFDNFRGFYEHASQRVPAVRDSLLSLLSASQKKLEEVRERT